MAKQSKDSATQGQSVLDEARQAQAPSEFQTNYWPTDADDTDLAPLVTIDGTPRLYWFLEPGATLFGYYLGCEVLKMTPFGGNPNSEEEKEERAFYLFEVATPPGYKGAKPYAVKARKPRNGAIIEVPVGGVVHVGVRTRLQPISLFSGLDKQLLVGLLANGQEKTQRGFNLWGFEIRAWMTDRPALRTLVESQTGDAGIAAMFAVQDRGLYAAQQLFGMVIPERFDALAKRQGLKPGDETKQIEASTTPVASAEEMVAKSNMLPVTSGLKQIPPST